jgi:FlaA1/EpsC-like NDP-sugar epimerase
MVSTDKAVNPTSIMGCTKQLAERVVYDYSQTSNTRFAVVRFGNVLASAGSVIPYFQEQIRKGGPITITDERMTRYFMSIPEAAQLVMQSAAMCKGGEIYVLDMGEPVSIVQLAQDLVSLSGLPAGSIEFEIVGARPGEKLYEELYFDDEHTIETQHRKVRAAYPRDYQGEPILGAVQRLFALVDDNPAVLRQEIAALVPSYCNESILDKTAAAGSGH